MNQPVGKDRLTVLFVDDDPEICEVFVALFSSPTVHVLTYTDPIRAVEYAKISAPDLVIVDYRMPQMVGDQVAMSMPEGFPIYLLTGELDPEVKFKFAGILRKPFKHGEIAQVISQLRK